MHSTQEKALVVRVHIGSVPLAGSVGPVIQDVHDDGLLVGLDVVGHGDGVAVGAGVQTPARERLKDNQNLQESVWDQVLPDL